MQSKTSFFKDRSSGTSPQTGAANAWFNPTVFKKNLTRFAPVWVAYGLLVLVFLFMLYSEETRREYGKYVGFVESFSWSMVELFMYWNMAYALLTAQLVFGDLYNSRMCNALHAMPLRRETWFVTNCLSGLAFSVIPTFAAMLVLIPMLSVSIVENAWTLALLWLLSTNLQFLCCFGLAAFAAMCVGSRLTMAAGYGLLQCGSWIAYYLVDTVYTPMLYGVITPITLVNNLSPLSHMTGHRFVQIEDMIYEHEMAEQGLHFSDMTLQLTLTEHWWRIFAIAAVGLVFAALALLLYRKRDLECAGDAVAFPALKPVFQVLCALFIMWAGQFLVTFMLGKQEFGIPIMAICLVAGWFIGKMLIERTTRVFRLNNWYGLGVLAACLALTLAATHFDVLGIEQRLPDLEKVESIWLETNNTSMYEMDESGWEDVLQLHALAAGDQVEQQGLYIIEPDGTRREYFSYDGNVMPAKQGYPSLEELLGYEDYVRAGNIRITYEMKNGSRMQRRYNIWSDGETGELARRALSDWEVLTNDKVEIDGELVKTVDAALDDFIAWNVTGYDFRELEIFEDKAEALSFLEAVKKDAQAGLMMQDGNFHRGAFVKEEEDYYGETCFVTRDNLWVSIESRKGAWDVRVFPDCKNTMDWLMDRGLVNHTVYPDAIILPG